MELCCLLTWKASNRPASWASYSLWVQLLEQHSTRLESTVGVIGREIEGGAPGIRAMGGMELYTGPN